MNAGKFFGFLMFALLTILGTGNLIAFVAGNGTLFNLIVGVINVFLAVKVWGEIND